MTVLWVAPGPAVVAGEPFNGTHDLSDQVKVLWNSRYDGPASKVDSSRAMAVSPDGAAIFVTGSSLNSGTDSDYATVAIDANSGEEIWVARYGAPGPYPDEARAIAVDPDSRKVFVTGVAANHYTTIAYDAATGREIWSTDFG
jgi:outer membrane protein assembly factor BamB